MSEHLCETLTPGCFRCELNRDEVIDQYIEVVREAVAKMQYLVNWLDGRGLLPDHTFTFPDGDTWEATL